MICLRKDVGQKSMVALGFIGCKAVDRVVLALGQSDYKAIAIK